jgi:dipeptidase E
MESMPMTLLLLSTVTAAGAYGFAPPVATAVAQVLGSRVRRVLFIPYASVLASADDVTATVRQAFANILYEVSGLHEAADPVRAITEAEAIAVGGGNTFKLLASLYEMGLFHPLCDRVRAGVPYIGWSAGANIAAPTIMTTNDMPIVATPTLEALNVIPFQINPHFDAAPAAPGQGESRVQRLAEYCEMHALTPVVGLRDGSILMVHGRSIRVQGAPACVFDRSGARDHSSADVLDFLWGEASAAAPA